MNEHYQRLEQMFHKAPIQGMLPGASMKVSEGKAEYSLQIEEDYFHAANAMHGAIYFKLLDDAAYFAAASLETECFILTKSYTIHFRRPVEADSLRALGEVVSVENGEFIAKSSIFNSAGKLVAQGEGIFVKGPKPLTSLPAYKS
ncbi:MAG: PaaI family thioesterase [Roseivirga sp.]|nr:PaaI family thioesterase [Roseivirga sp.]